MRWGAYRLAVGGLGMRVRLPTYYTRMPSRHPRADAEEAVESGVEREDCLVSSVHR